jgi:hypothetical protein
LEPYDVKNKAGTKDKVKFTDTWILLIQRATLMKAKTNWFMFIHTVKTLIDVLFEEERRKVKTYIDILQKEQPNLNRVEKHDLILTYVIDILKEKGCLSAEISFTYGGGDMDRDEESATKEYGL